MTRYNYTRAGEIWSEFYNTMVDPWELDENERRQARRNFMHDLTRGDGSQYIKYIDESLDCIRPVDDAKSRCYDFELMRDYEQVKQLIIDFCEVANND